MRRNVVHRRVFIVALLIIPNLLSLIYCLFCIFSFSVNLFILISFILFRFSSSLIFLLNLKGSLLTSTPDVPNQDFELLIQPLPHFLIQPLPHLLIQPLPHFTNSTDFIVKRSTVVYNFENFNIL